MAQVPEDVPLLPDDAPDACCVTLAHALGSLFTSIDVVSFVTALVAEILNFASSIFCARSSARFSPDPPA
jgi:hypothetical protein